jgi:hypothetical protein
MTMRDILESPSESVDGTDDHRNGAAANEDRQTERGTYREYHRAPLLPTEPSRLAANAACEAVRCQAPSQPA